MTAPPDSLPPPQGGAIPGQNPSWTAPTVPQGPPAPMPAGCQPTALAFTGWAPFQGAAKTSAQAGDLVAHLLHWTAQRATNPYWGAHFWREVALMEQGVGFEPDLQRTLRGAGYNGPSTTGPPRGSLKSDLEALRDLGSPALGAGLAHAQGSAALPMPIPYSGMDGRWQSGLPPDLNRAAPEIYRALRSEGVNNVREWMNANFYGEKSAKNSEWLELWNLACEADFALERQAPEHFMSFLSSDDSMEIKMRRLASYVHLKRSGDLNSATRMLAIKPPGTNMDLAPNWLVDESTSYSKAEHQRRQRVSGSGGNNRGRGRGRAGQGGDSQPQADGRGRGRCRGRN